MKELIGIVLFGLFGFAIWKTRQAATTAPRCPTIDELEAINRDIYEGKTDLVDAENLATSYDAIKGCESAAASIRATILAKKSTGATSTATPGDGGLLVSPDVVKKNVVDVDTLLVSPEFTKDAGTYPLGKSLDPLSVEALSSPIREDVKYLIAKPRGEWNASDMAIYSELSGAGKKPSDACGGLQLGLILRDWLDRHAFQCNPSIDEYKAGVRKTVLADHPDNALTLLFARAAGG